MLAVVALVVLWYLSTRAAKIAGGIVTGNNALTQSQTDASGSKVTAYEGAGILGTLGAAFNTASGGVLASAGEKVADTFASFSDVGQ